MRSVARSVSGKQVDMAGETKTRDREKAQDSVQGQKDRVEQFAESREVLHRAMEKDHKCAPDIVDSTEDEGFAAKRAEFREANANRLASLLEAARTQDALPPSQRADYRDDKAEQEPPWPANTGGARSAPAPLPVPAIEAGGSGRDFREPSAAPNAQHAEPMPAPLVDREENERPISAAGVIIRIGVAAAIFAGFLFTFLMQESEKAADNPDGVSTVATSSDQPVSGPSSSSKDAQSGVQVSGDTASPEMTTAETRTPEIATQGTPDPTGPAKTGADAAVSPAGLPVKADRPVMSAVPLAADKGVATVDVAKSSAATAAPFIPAVPRGTQKIRLEDIPAPPPPPARPAHIMAPQEVVKSDVSAKSVPATSVRAESSVDTKVQRPVEPETALAPAGADIVNKGTEPKNTGNGEGTAAVTPPVSDASPPAPEPAPSLTTVVPATGPATDIGTAGATPAPAEPVVANGGAQETPLPAPPAADTADPAIPADKVTSADTLPPAASKQRVADRRPYFQRLGPRPARNPFRTVPPIDGSSRVEQPSLLLNNLFFDVE